MDRIETVVYQCWYSTSNVTTTQKQQVEIAKVDYTELRAKLDAIQKQLAALEAKMNASGVPYTPNRPDFKED